MSGRNCDLPHSSHLTVIAGKPFTSTLQVKRQPSSSPVWPIAALVIKSVSSWSPMKQQDVTFFAGTYTTARREPYFVRANACKIFLY